MDQKCTGFAIMLLSLILMIGFQSVGWKHIGDLSMEWAHLWMMTAVAGFVMTIYDKKK